MAERREYKGAAAPAKLSSAITNSATTITIDTTSGWPTGSVGPFYIVIDPGTSTEEKIKCASRSGSAITVAASGRGVDGTSAVAHAVGAVVKHVFTANDADLTNKHAADTAQDDHTQYMHNTAARTISAAHSFTGNPAFSGTPNFSGAPTFGGNPIFSGTPQFSNMGQLVELQTIDGGAASAGSSPRPMRADAKLRLDLIAIERAVWKAGDYKLSSATGLITSEWLECNGQAVSRATYPALWEAIGATYGAGNGTTTFNVPDWRDRFLSGAGAGGIRAIDGTGGADTVTLTTGNLPAHTHTMNHDHNVTDPGHAHGIPRANSGAFTQYTTNYVSSNTDLGWSDTYPATTGLTVNHFTGNTGSIGSATAFSTVPRWRGARVLIKAH